jgi:hypothetical protein
LNYNLNQIYSSPSVYTPKTTYPPYTPPSYPKPKKTYTPPAYPPYTPPPYTLPRFRLKQKPKRYKFKSKVQRGYKYTPSLYSRIFKIKFGTKLFKSRTEKTGLGLRPL